MNRSKRSPAALWAAGLVLAALIGCGGEETVASKSAAAFEEAQKRGETFGGDGHGHGHDAVTPGGGGATEGAPAEDAHAGHAHAGAPATAGEAMPHDGAQGGHTAMDHGRRPASAGHEGHAAMDHGGHSAAPSAPGSREGAGQAGQHAGHGAMTGEGPQTGTPPGDHSGHAAHSPSAGAMPSAASAPTPVAVPSEQPARTLRPDALDAPAATSVLDAQRSAEMAREMAGGHGGHGGHGSSTYRHVDAGRGPGAYQESEPQTPGAEPQHHDHGSAEILYVCPMHPEVTSKTPGTCPKCGMTLVERRKG